MTSIARLPLDGEEKVQRSVGSGDATVGGRVVDLANDALRPAVETRRWTGAVSHRQSAGPLRWPAGTHLAPHSLLANGRPRTPDTDP